LNLATRLEGHPDNAAAALLGGLVVSAAAHDAGKGVLAVRLPVVKFPGLAVFIPDTELATDTARGVLPDAVFRADANFNVAHTGLLLACLATEHWDGLREALKDRLHQEHRAALMPGFHAILHAAVENGAYGATLSGAGPSILAWTPTDDSTLAETCQAMQDAAAAHEVFGRAVVVAVDLDGTVVLDS
jgi:homoserine kinase